MNSWKGIRYPSQIIIRVRDWLQPSTYACDYYINFSLVPIYIQLISKSRSENSESFVKSCTLSLQLGLQYHVAKSLSGIMKFNTKHRFEKLALSSDQLHNSNPVSLYSVVPDHKNLLKKLSNAVNEDPAWLSQMLRDWMGLLTTDKWPKKSLTTDKNPKL